MAKAIEVRVTEEEYQRLHDLALKRGFQSVTAYMKAIALQPKDSLEKRHNPLLKAG